MPIHKSICCTQICKLIVQFTWHLIEWLPNKDGGKENYDAIELFHHMNEQFEEQAPGTMIIAEESCCQDVHIKVVHQNFQGHVHPLENEPVPRVALCKKPMAVYEVHLGSWKKKDDGTEDHRKPPMYALDEACHPTY